MTQYDGVDREAVWAGLFAHLELKLAAAGFKTMSRRHVQPPTLTAALQPAFFLVEQREGRKPKLGLPNRLTLSGYIVLYFRGPDPLQERIGKETVLPATRVNGFLKAIDDAFIPDDFSSGKFTLGGLFEHAWIEGDVEIDPCMYTAQGAALLPINTLVP